MFEQVNAAVFVFADMGARGPAVLELRRVDFEALRHELCAAQGPDADIGGVRVADAESLDFHTPIGTVTVQPRSDTVLGVPRFLLVERESGRQHAIMAVETRDGVTDLAPAPEPDRRLLN